MKKKIAILGSTGSIGKNLIKIIKKDKQKFKVVLLTADKNYHELLNQANDLNVKNLIITDKKSYKKILSLNIKKINIFNNFNSFNKIFSGKVDYSMCAISGLNGLLPTFKLIKYSKKIAIANKESIICAWDLISKELKKNKTSFIPVDSEHFSLWFGLENSKALLRKCFITASGGPFLNLPLKSFSKIKIKEALNHPNWKMGKKISIDSSTMMNKVFEVIEAKNIFKIPYKNIEILVHKDSYIHAILQFNNGMFKIIAHDTTMMIPIYNSINYTNYSSKINNGLPSSNLNISKLNNLRLMKPDIKKFPILKILKNLPQKSSLYETIIVSINDELVEMYLKNEIRFTDITKLFFKFAYSSEFLSFKKKKIKKIHDIINLNKFVRFKIRASSI